MLASRLPGILPALTAAEAVEATRIHSLTGRGGSGRLIREPPFRAPHHSITAAGLVGGANPRRPGEAVLAHHGVLFLDELSEFSRATLEALRQPLEDGRVLIARAAHTSVQPARFILVAATNPCPCGLGPGDQRCGCTEADLARHRRRMSGPLIDRLDILVDLVRPSHDDLRAAGRLTSARGREAVRRARARQAVRAGRPAATNARMDFALLRRDAALDRRGERVLAQAHQSGLLSARAHHRIVRVARTIADIDDSRRVHAEHVIKALALRRELAAARGQVA
jgi:magnesium chelatase family protein